MRTSPYRFIYACIFVLLPGMLRAQTDNENQKINKLVTTFVDLDQFSGSVLVAKKGKVVFSKGYGLANREWNVANTAGTKFRIGSLTKQFTALLIMQLYQEGKIDLGGYYTE